MSQISQLSKLAVSIAVCISFTLLLLSIPQLPPGPQQPNHAFCHISLWLVGVVPFSTDRNVFFACIHFLPADTFVREAHFYRLFLHQSKRDGNVREKVWRTLFIVSPVLLGLSTQFKNWYIVSRLHQHIKSEPRLTEALSRCYVILYQSRDLIMPAWSSTPNG